LIDDDVFSVAVQKKNAMGVAGCTMVIVDLVISKYELSEAGKLEHTG